MIYVDSQSTLAVLCSALCGIQPMVFAIQYLLWLPVSAGFLVHLCWLLSHLGIQANKLADVYLPHIVIFLLFFFFSCGRFPSICQFIGGALQTWWSLWDQQGGNKVHHWKPDIGLWQLNLHANHHKEVMLAHLPIGHCSLTHYVVWWRSSCVCELCDAQLTAHHQLLVCYKVTHFRVFYFSLSHITYESIWTLFWWLYLFVNRF